MMLMFQKITAYLSDLTDKEFKRYIVIFFASLGIILLFGTYRYYRSVFDLKKQMKRINITRTEVQGLLTKYDQIKKQKETVDALLNQDKSFWIKRYFDDTLKKLDISHMLTKEPDIIETDLKEGYTEITLSANFARIDSQQMAELLNELEQKKRIYIKKLDITKARNSNTLSFVIIIATLKTQTESPENVG